MQRRLIARRIDCTQRPPISLPARGSRGTTALWSYLHRQPIYAAEIEFGLIFSGEALICRNVCAVRTSTFRWRTIRSGSLTGRGNSSEFLRR